MSVLELSQLSLQEKFQIMESIWEDLRPAIDHADTPKSHQRILDDRRQRTQQGEDQLLDWDQVKNSIGKK